MKTADDLLRQLGDSPCLTVLSGAGLSAASGIPTYRDDSGRWLRSDPIQHPDFIAKPASRQRYWARSMLGWSHVALSQPNRGHLALAQMEAAGAVNSLTTQNVDRLHQRAGHRRVIDLHGRLDRVVCLDCGAQQSRDSLQAQLQALNPKLLAAEAAVRPDGDADIADEWVNGFVVPECSVCSGTLMPDVVFFGGTVPRQRVEQTERAVHDADALLVAGSSLTVFSGFRFARLAHRLGKPLFILNRGTTRADDLASLKIDGDCSETLDYLATKLGIASASVS